MISPATGAFEGQLLFVYGTLRRGFRLHYHLRRLGARFLTEAKVAGELIDCGSYPGARPTAQTGRWVRGESFQLRHEHDWRVLDQLEGVAAGAPQRSQFIRAPVEVVIENSARRGAWIYWLPRRLTAARRIVSGDYASKRLGT